MNYVITVAVHATRGRLTIGYVGPDDQLTNDRAAARRFSWSDALEYLRAYGMCHEAHILRSD